jgi:Sulfotransferase family
MGGTHPLAGDLEVAEQAETKDPSAAPSETPPADEGPAFENHVEQRTIVLPELRVLFLPIPKAGCTSILWLLAELAGIPLDRFAHSDLAEPSPALTIHDMSLWPDENRLGGQPEEERERALTEEGWFRFTVVRDPAPRLWSAWQSKLLLREPRFLATFGDEPWFPRMPERPAELVEDFRRFVLALGPDGPEDVHWAVQHDLAEQLPLDHVGRVERLNETLGLLRAHVGGAVWPAERPRENRSPIPMPPGAYDEPATAVVRDLYREDFEQYGYEPPETATDGETDAAWAARVEPMLPLLRVAASRHARIGELHTLAQRRTRQARALGRRLEKARKREARRRDTDHATAPILTNLEGDESFEVRWAWSKQRLEPGFTAVVRVKNEARSLPWVLPPLFRAVRKVVVVDNGSTDDTADVARHVTEEAGAADRFELLSYPFSVARCGSEHLETPANSVHSLAYFYNWSFSHVTTDYALKWDGDMVLADSAVDALRDLAWQLEAREAIVRMPRYPLYVTDERRAFLDIGLSNREAWAWPNRPGYSFVKALEWELPLWAGGSGSDVMTTMLPDWACVELKHLDADEFGHWSDSDFDATERTQRKRREWQVFHTLADGAEPPEGVVPIEAPDGVHVIDYVRSTWLPQKAPELAGRAERLIGRLARLTV